MPALSYHTPCDEEIALVEGFVSGDVRSSVALKV